MPGISSLPPLRVFTSSASSGSFTVPVGKTYKVQFVNVNPTSFIGSAQINATLNGNSFRLLDYSTSLSPPQSSSYKAPVEHGAALGESIIMHAADSISWSYSTTYATRIFYWIIEDDFNLSDVTIPNLRRQTRASAGSFTVPVGQTWIVRILSYSGAVSTIIGGSLRGAVWVSSNISGTSSDHAGFAGLNGSAEALIRGGSCIQSKLIMQAGDTVTLSTAATVGAVRMDIGYWILEQDF